VVPDARTDSWVVRGRRIQDTPRPEHRRNSRPVMAREEERGGSVGRLAYRGRSARGPAVLTVVVTVAINMFGGQHSGVQGTECAGQALLNDATATLQNAGLRVPPTRQKSDSKVPPKTRIDHNPAAGASVAAGGRDPDHVSSGRSSARSWRQERQAMRIACRAHEGGFGNSGVEVHRRDAGAVKGQGARHHPPAQPAQRRSPTRLTIVVGSGPREQTGARREESDGRAAPAGHRSIRLL